MEVGNNFSNFLRLYFFYLILTIGQCQLTGFNHKGPPTFENGIYESITLTEDSTTPHFMRCSVNDSETVMIRKEGNTTIKNLGLKVFLEQEEENSSRLKVIVLTFFTGDRKYEGIYICTAKNRFGSVDKIFNVTVQPKPDSISQIKRPNTTIPISPTATGPEKSNNNNVIAGVSVTIAVVTLLLVWILYEFFGSGKNGLTKEEIQEFLLGNTEAIRSEAFAHENANYMPYKNSYEVPQDKLYIDRRELLGSGQYGEVFKGRYNSRSVAVKTVKPGADKMYLKSLLAELKIMIYLGTHPNIISLVGASTSKLGMGQLYIIVDCCEFGNLESYLRKHKNSYVNQMDPYGKVIKSTLQGVNELCTRDFIVWSHQIAKAMDYLASKKVIHGDLATRNVLLADRHTAKITDFGLSRQLYDYTPNYQKQNMEPLPWRWMAYESLRELTFSTQSDAWSYGVTLWEIFTLGEVPYAGLFWTKEFVDSLMESCQLTKPDFMPHEIYCEVIKCWSLEPKKRPTFKHMEMYFQKYFGDFSIPYEAPHV